MSIMNGVNDEIFRGFAFYAVASILKLMAMALLTASQRFRKIAFANPEDIPSGNRGKVKPNTTDPDVERVRRNHLNDMENIFPFVLVGLFYITCNPSSTIALWHFRGFFISRILHTLSYQIPIPQPSRALTFLIGYGITVSMAVQVLLYFF